MKKNSFWRVTLPLAPVIKVHLVHGYVLMAFDGDSSKQRHVCTAVRQALSALCREVVTENPSAPAPFEVPFQLKWEELRRHITLVELQDPSASTVAADVLRCWLFLNKAVAEATLLENAMRLANRRTGGLNLIQELARMRRTQEVRTAKTAHGIAYSLNANVRSLMSTVPQTPPEPGIWRRGEEELELISIRRDPFQKHPVIVLSTRHGVETMPMELFLTPVAVPDGGFVPRFTPVGAPVGR